MMKRFPLGIQTFSEIINGHYHYVDKTRWVYLLAHLGKYFFLSRPRRFGKSLLISTLESYFLGRRDLFKGLAVEQLEHDWADYPVLHFDLNAQQFVNKDDLADLLNAQLDNMESTYLGSPSPSQASPAIRFNNLIRDIFHTTGKQVVILVDEYDKPLVQSIDHAELQDYYRAVLKGFYGILKSCDPYIHFALLTGVSRFSHVSIFSDLNNLTDISMSPQFAALCGITEDELKAHFDEDVRLLASANDITREQAYAKLRTMYDGYHFCEHSPAIYNPFSLFNTLSNRKFLRYWYSTGTPTLLLKALEQNHYNLSGLQGAVEDASSLMSSDSLSYDPVPLFFQTGYLTIKSYDTDTESYTLDFPNQEVERGFTESLMPHYLNLHGTTKQSVLLRLVAYINSGDVDGFMSLMQSFMADTPYELIRDMEVYYQNVIFITFKLIGFHAQVERHTSQGRIDMVVQTARYIYIFEFKLEGSPRMALNQIADRNYAAPFANDPRHLYKIGVNFSSTTHNIDGWEVEE